MDFYRDIKKVIKFQITEFFEEFKLNFKNYFETIFDNKEIKNFSKFQNGFDKIKQKFLELKNNNNKNENLVTVFKNINFLNDSLFDLETIFLNLQKNFNTIKKSKFDLSYNKEGIFRHINLKATSFINLKKEEEKNQFEESQLLLETLSDFMKNSIDEKNFVNLKKKNQFVNRENYKELENNNNFEFNMSFDNKNNFKKMNINLKKKSNFRFEEKNNFRFENNYYEEKQNLKIFEKKNSREEINNISFKKECKKFSSIKQSLIISSIDKMKFQNNYFNKKINVNKNNKNLEKRKSFLSVEKTTYRSKRSILR